VGLAAETVPADKPVSFTRFSNVWEIENDNEDTLNKFTRMMGKLAAFAGTMMPNDYPPADRRVRDIAPAGGKHHTNTF